MRVILFFLILLTLFVGVPINGEWNMLYDFELISVPDMLFKYHSLGLAQVLLWLILIGFHLALCTLPFIIKKKYFGRALFIVPLCFFITYFILEPLTSLFLIPFLIAWILCMLGNKYNWFV